MKVYDAIVVGAGPAGLLAARKLAENNVEVLLLEKDLELGKKPCAEAISERGLLDAEIPIESNFIINKIFKAKVYPPNEEKFIEISKSGEHSWEGYIIDKPKFLKKLLDAATSKGVEARFRNKVVDVKRENNLMKVFVKENEEIENLMAKIVLGCDGYASLITKKFFNSTKIEYISCFQYTLSRCDIEDEHALSFYLGYSTAPLGYLWIFPKGNGVANVGVGVRKGSPKFYLDNFIQKHQSIFQKSEILSFGGAPVIVSGQLPKVTNDNLMICGEAAGQVIPFTGAGIHTGIVAGKIAGVIAAEAIKNNDLSDKALMVYKKMFDEVFGRNIEKSLKAMRVFEKLSDEDLNQLAEILSGEDVIDLANGLNIEKVAKKLFSHPILAVKIAKALL
ncbi:NAD(P)/FAD-dependent oxidoreductase [Candidatus Bathyarchaeota archaeon]|nr:NAD(P)/FAD-dependent oxidoreductase [Candidatus Bathyarchaeota archaeon]